MAIVCACNEPEFEHFSWPRLQQGFAAVEQQYGPSLLDLNSFALMAYKFNDSVIADSAFKRIGDQWDKDTWRTEDWFRQNQAWAAPTRPRRSSLSRHQAGSPGQPAKRGGISLKKDFGLKFAALESRA